MALRKFNDALEWATGRRLARVEQQTAQEFPPDFTALLATVRDQITVATTTSEVSSLKMFMAENFHQTQAQLFQDLWVLWELDLKRNGYFVEFGAFDGQVLSNTFLLETAYEWRGLLAEPNPDRHQSIRSSRTATLDERCVHDKSGEQVKLLVTPNSEYSTIEEHSESNPHRIGQSDTRDVLVNTVTLDDLLDQHAAPAVIDFLSMDTEGGEFEILNAHRWNRHIRCMSIEHNYTHKQTSIDQLLTKKGYVRRFPDLSKWDGWYIHENDLKRATRSA